MDYVLIEQLYQSSLKTPGETRPINKAVLEFGISSVVQKGLFGLGELGEDNPVCRYFKEQTSIAFSGNEVLISESICDQQTKKEDITAPDSETYKKTGY